MTTNLKLVRCVAKRQISNEIIHATYTKEIDFREQILKKIQEKYNYKTPEDWNSLSTKQIISNGGRRLLQNNSLYDLKCIGCPEGKSKYEKPAGYWKNKENVKEFVLKLKEKYNLKTPKDWNLITQNQIRSFYGANTLLRYYSMFDIKCLGCPEGKLIFNKPNQPKGFWEEKENVKEFLLEIKQKYNLKTTEDWNSLSREQIISNGGGSLFHKYLLYDLKCLGFPEGKFEKPQQSKPANYWENEENVKEFLLKLKEKYNLQSANDWNSITQKQISSLGGNTLLRKYSMFDLKCLGFPEGKLEFDLPNKSKPSKYWENEENVKDFLLKLKEEYNLKSANDWNLITQKQIILIGGSTLLRKYSMFEIKCLGFPEGELEFDKPNKSKPSKYWENKENVTKFLLKLKKIYNLQNFDDWNSLTSKQVISNGGSALFNHYTLYQLKCFVFPEGSEKFDKQNPSKPLKYWKNKENVKEFLLRLKRIYNLQNFDDWNSLTSKQICINGGSSLLTSFTLYQLKCFGFPEGKLKFNKPNNYKPSKYWENEENVKEFLLKLKEEYNLQSANDWNLLSTKQVQLHGGRSLLKRYSMYEIKCLGFPEGKLFYDKPVQYKPTIPSEYWNNEENRTEFLNKLKVKYNLKTPVDWQRLSSKQIKLDGGFWLFYNDMEYLKNTQIQFEILDDKNKLKKVSYPLKDLIDSKNKRSSQRWLFLQIQKLFPGEEIVEDYFHSDISRETGFAVQFDIFLLNKFIAFEYHGEQHYQDIPSAFGSLEMVQYRDYEKENLCKKYGITLIIIPYWWDNKLNSLRETVFSALNRDNTLQSLSKL